jgi:hypothetical protein
LLEGLAVGMSVGAYVKPKTVGLKVVGTLDGPLEGEMLGE